jgi:hypothetical protein
MSDGKDPTTENRAQFEHFLSWRQANFRRRAARRRRWFGYVAVVSFAVIGVALVAWVTESARDARGRVTFERRQAPPESVAAASHDSAPPARLSAPPAGAVIERTPAEEGPRVTARGTSRIEPFKRSSGASQARPLPPRQPSSLRSPVAEDPPQTSDVAGGMERPDASLGLNEAVSPPSSRTPTAPPASVPTSPLPKETIAEPSGPIASVAPTNPKPDDAQTVAPPPSKQEAVTASAAPPNISDTVARAGSDGASSTEAGQSQAGHRQPKGQVVAESVVSWLEGEVQELRDAAEREIGEFRAGFDKVRRHLLRLPSCLARAIAEDRPIAEDRNSCSPAPRRP